MLARKKRPFDEAALPRARQSGRRRASDFRPAHNHDLPQGFFPVGIEHPDQLAEISAELRRLGRETSDAAVEPLV
jgi:hypothetical protein